MRSYFTKDWLKEVFLLMKKEQFSGQFILKNSLGCNWVFHLFLGRILYASGGIHPVRRWRRNLTIYCPQTELEQLNSSANLPTYSATAFNICWEYHLLSDWVERRQVSREQVAKMVLAIAAEMLFDVLQAMQVTYQFKPENLSSAQLTLLDAEQLIAEAMQKWDSWQEAHLADVSPNLVPVINQPEQLQQEADDQVQTLTTLMDGQSTLRDLTVKMRWDVVLVTHLLLPHIQAGLLELIDIPDLPAPILSPSPEAVFQESSVTLVGVKQLQKQNNFILPLENQPARRTPALPLGWIGLSLLLLLTAGGYYFFQNQVTPATVKSLKSSLAISPASDIQLYNSMRAVPNVPNGLFNYGGAIVFAPLRSPSVVAAITKAQPQFQLRYVEPVFDRRGAHKGVAMLINNELSFSQNAMPLDNDEYSRARERGFRLQEVPVGINGIVFYTHPGLKIAGLSVNQLRDIFTGKLTNWRQVGGPDLAIVPIGIDPKDSSTFSILFSGTGGPDSARNLRIARD